jgi:hypothetical protein
VTASGPEAFPEFVPGFSYPIGGAIVQEARIRVKGWFGAAYDEWCSDFIPVLSTMNAGETHYACLTNDDWMTAASACKHEGDPLACAKTLCSQMCACDETVCGAVGDEQIQLDGSLGDAGEALTGTLVLKGERLTVKMTRN